MLPIVKDEAKGERLVVLYLSAVADRIDQNKIKERLKEEIYGCQ